MGKKEKQKTKDAVEEQLEGSESQETEQEKQEITSDDKVTELTDDLKRVQADFENYKKRCEKESSNFREFAKADLIKKLLTILDSFEMALKNTEKHDEFVKGTELIFSQLYSLLKNEGVDHINTENKKFDPYKHEVMLTSTSDKEDDTILEELQKGYTLKGQVLRHSKVKISKK